MSSDNTVVFVGNLVSDPEHTVTTGGVHRTKLRLAVNRRWFNSAAGQWEDRLDGYFNVIAWRRTARNAAQSLSKGVRVLVLGRMTVRSYQTKQGETRWVQELEADEVCASLRWKPVAILETDRTADAADGDEPGPPTPSTASAEQPSGADDLAAVPF